MLRKIVRIDEERCDGCGQCIPACAEGAIAVVGGKARIADDVLCDGLGACLGECPQGAISVVEREAVPFDGEAVQAHLLSMGEKLSDRRRPVPASAPSPAPLARPRLAVLSGGGAVPEGGGCPGSRPMSLPRRTGLAPASARPGADTGESRLAQWPVQLHLVPIAAPWFRGAELLVAADCVPFAYARFHGDLLAGRALVVGCPKLDDLAAYVDKLGRICRANDLRSIVVARMEVPCCGGITAAARRAIESSGKEIPLRDVVVSVDGTIRG